MARLSPGRKDGTLPDRGELARNSGEKAALPILTFSAFAGPRIEAQGLEFTRPAGDRAKTVRRPNAGGSHGSPIIFGDGRGCAAGIAAVAAGTAATRAAHAAGGKTFVLVHGAWHGG
jgi:hypothetical protein